MLGSRLLALFALVCVVCTTAGTAGSSGPIQNPANGHWYELITLDAKVNFEAARAGAQARTAAGLPGHLATITSPEEQQFVNSVVAGSSLHEFWLGGVQPADAPEPGGNWGWVTGEPWAYSNWNGGEPNQTEDSDVLSAYPSGCWNDTWYGDAFPGYLVEYEAPGAPWVPGNLTAWTVSPTEVRLTWVDGSPNETDFEIERKVEDGEYALLATVPAGATSYSDTAVAPRTRCAYRVRAVNELGASPYSNEAEADNTVTFAGPFNYPVPSPRAVTPVDLDRDGRTDFLVTSGENVVVLYGRGDGTLEPAVSYTVSRVEIGDWGEPIAADVNRDGRLDLVTPIGPASKVSVCLGEGHRGFAPYVHYPAPPRPNGVVARDFNRDGWVDLALSCHYGHVMAVLLNRRDGTFDTPTAYDGGDLPARLASADFNGDGNWDVAMSNYLSYDVWLYFGNGRGRFTRGRKFGVGAYPAQILTADFNRDGIADLATANTFSNNVSVLMGQGNGKFRVSPFYPANQYPAFMAAADLDGDGFPDLVAPNNGTDYFTVLQNDGHGAMRSPQKVVSGGEGARSLAVGDLNGDGRPDVVIGNEYSSDLSVFLNTSLPPANPLEPPSNLTPTVRSATAVDLAWKDNSLDETGFQVERKLGAGTFAVVATPPAGTTAYADSGLRSGATYTYRVRAMSATGLSGPSNPAMVTLPAAPVPPPAAPRALRVSVFSSTTLQLDWQDESDDEAGFRIERRLPGEAFASLATTPANTTRHRDYGLRPDTPYEYRVCAYNSAGSSGWSNVAAGRTPGAAPAGPVGLFANPVSAGEVRLTWSDRSDNENGFRIERRVGETEFTALASVPADSTAYSDASVAPRTTYVYRVVAFTGGSDSRPSNEASATTPGGGGSLQVAAAIHFGAVRRGSIARRIVVLRNASPKETLQVTLTPPAGPFGLEGLGKSLLLAPGARSLVGLPLTFRPSRRGDVTGWLRLTSTDSNRPRVAVRLTGTGR